MSESEQWVLVAIWGPSIYTAALGMFGVCRWMSNTQQVSRLDVRVKSLWLQIKFGLLLGVDVSTLRLISVLLSV